MINGFTLKDIQDRVEKFTKELSVEEVLKMDMLSWNEEARKRAIKELQEEMITKLEKVLEDTYSDIFPEGVVVNTTEDIYKIRNEYSNAIKVIQDGLKQKSVA